MRKIEGQINEFKKLNIMEKLLEKYRNEDFFRNFNAFQNKKQYRRVREEPKVSQQTLRQQSFANQTTEKYLKYKLPDVENRFNKQVTEYANDIKKLIVFSQHVNKLVVDKTYKFGKDENQGQYQAPKRLCKEEEDEITEGMNNQVQVRKYSNLKDDKYDFDKINKIIREDDLDQKKNLTSYQADFPIVIELADINQINEFEEIDKIFYYHAKNDSFESRLKNNQKYNYRMFPKKDSIILSRDSLTTKKSENKTKNIRLPIQFARDMGSISRKPPTDLSNLTSVELTIVPTELRFCDLMNIASGRLIRQNIALCVRNSAVTKQDLEYQRSILQKLQAKNKATMDKQVQAGDQDIGILQSPQDNGNGKHTDKQKDKMKGHIQTERLVSDINELRKKIRDKGQKGDSKIEEQFVANLQILLQKVIEDTDLHSTGTIMNNFAQQCTKIDGITRSGFQKKKLLWFYADCMRYFNLAQSDENIKYLIDKSAKQKTTNKVVIRENFIQPYTQTGLKKKAYTIITKEKISKKATQNSKSPYKIREFSRFPIKPSMRSVSKSPIKTQKKIANGRTINNQIK